MSELDETIERLCEIEHEARKKAGCISPEWDDMPIALQGAIRAGIRAVYEAVLSGLRPMPDRLEVANVLGKARYINYDIAYTDWERDVPYPVRRETEVMLKLFAGRTNAEAEDDVLMIVTQKAEMNRLGAEGDALAAKLEALKSSTPELTDAEVERACEVYFEAQLTRFSFINFASSTQDISRDGIRAVLANAPRLPYQPPEGVTLDGLQTVIDQNKYGWQGAFVLDYLGITLPTVPTIELDGPQTAEQLRAAADALEANA